MEILIVIYMYLCNKMHLNFYFTYSILTYSADDFIYSENNWYYLSFMMFKLVFYDLG